MHQIVMLMALSKRYQYQHQMVLQLLSIALLIELLLDTYNR